MHTIPPPMPSTTRLRSKDVFVERKPPHGEVFRYNLETVLQLLAVEGNELYDAELMERMLRNGVPITSNQVTWTVIPEHQDPMPARTSGDDPTATYKLLQALLPRDQLKIVDELLRNVGSRLRNLAQITSFNAELWHDEFTEIGEMEDALTGTKLEAITDALTHAAAELDVLMGGGLGRARELPAFSFPACWTGLVPTQPDLNPDVRYPKTTEELREELAAERGYEDAKHQKTGT